MGKIYLEMVVVRFLVYTLLSLLVATCGQKGPLYLPGDENPHPAKQDLQVVLWKTNFSKLPE